MTARKEIRDRVACIIRETKPLLTVYVGDFFSIADDAKPLAAIYFDDGSLEQQGLKSSIMLRSALDIDFFSGIGDDELDSLADPVIEAVLADQALRDMSVRVGYAGFRYSRDEGQGYAALKAMFEFTYVM